MNAVIEVPKDELVRESVKTYIFMLNHLTSLAEDRGLI
jgi:hypothetical protein